MSSEFWLWRQVDAERQRIQEHESPMAIDFPTLADDVFRPYYTHQKTPHCKIVET